MRWLQSKSQSSTTSSSSSSPFSAHSSRNQKGNINKLSNLRISRNNNNNNNCSSSRSSNNNNTNNNDKKDLRGPRLTRQKKVRHLRDQQIVGGAKIAHADTGESGWPRDNDHSSAALRKSTSAPVPLPLPLPLPLPVAEDNGGRGVEERERDGFRGRVDATGEGVSSSNSPTRRRIGKNIPEYSDMRSPRTVHQDLNGVERSGENIRISIPTKSTPTSPYASPILSPQRSVGEMFQYKVPKESQQGLSALEMRALDIPGIPPPAFTDYTAVSTESSPFHSPRSRSPCRSTISPSGPSSPIHSKLSRESTGLVKVYPLPLPPGAGTLLPSAPSLQVSAKPESLPMNSQWQKGKLIGRGTFGSVYAASNRETGALCVMKEVEMFPDDPKSAECIKQLQQEIEVLSQLKHPNIVQYYGSEIVKDKFCIYLEYVHPGSINKYIHEHCEAITESVVRNFTRHILCGLAYLHSKKTIHRDIKGANLLVDASGVVKLADFGMAKHLTGQVADLSLKGSPYWMAPELMKAVMQKDNNSDLAFAVDIWSLGCTIIEMLTGKPPWSEYEGAAAMFKVTRDSPAIPESLSAEGKDFLRCCFRRNPAERPSASLLLEHRFLKNSQKLDVPSHYQSFSGMKLSEKPHSPRERSDGKFDQDSVPPNSQSTKKANLESENGQPWHHETSNLTVTSLCSPRSALEVPGLSPPRSGHSSHHSGTSTIVLDRIGRGSKMNLINR